MEKWTEERVALLTKLWCQDRLSASQCAERLGGGVTRNAVLSKIHRHGIADRSGSRSQSVRKPRVKTRSPPVASAPRPDSNAAFRKLLNADAASGRLASQYEEIVIPLNERKTIQTLAECNCRWPIGDPQHADFHFCGKDKVAGLPYCEFHARRAYQPPSAAKKKVDNVETVRAIEAWKKREPAF